MAELQIFKELALPETLVANSIYLVANNTSDFLDVYVTGIDASVVKRSVNRADILALIAESAGEESGLGNLSQIVLVENIVERDALVAGGKDLFVLVKDATGDSTVTIGAASYVLSGGEFYKIAEYESMDLVTTWTNLQGRPNVTATQIEAAVAASHSHANITTLNKLGHTANGLTLDGVLVSNVVFQEPKW